MRIAMFDYGAGNLHSLGKALEAGGATVTVTRDWTEALALEALVLPGVGAFAAAVRSLGPEAVRVRDSLEAGLPCLGICLGMQLFFDRSDEGVGEGIGFIPGSVRRLRTEIVPQMGWNDVRISHTMVSDGLVETSGSRVGRSGPGRTEPQPAATGPDPLFVGLDGLVAYYANSYVCHPLEDSSVIAVTTHQGEIFPAAVRKKNTWGVQFHPEKSSAPGLRLIANFLREVEP
jgi:imidazole glycerol-phosphate synthase subunit HisH